MQETLVRCTFLTDHLHLRLKPPVGDHPVRLVAWLDERVAVRLDAVRGRLERTGPLQGAGDVRQLAQIGPIWYGQEFDGAALFDECVGPLHGSKATGTVIPARRITEKQARGKVPGFISHGELDPGRRSDPGAHYPWVAFLARYAELTRDLGTTPDGAFNPDDKEDFLNMAEISETRLREIIREENNRVIGNAMVGINTVEQKVDNLTVRIGQARGWLVAIALKLHPTLAAAKRDANDYDLNNPKKKG